jgi:hypothetical protein
MRVDHNEAAKYDLITSGQASTSLIDTRSLHGSTCTHVSFKIAEAILEATILVLRVMLRSDHPLVISAASFMYRYNADRLSIHHRLASQCDDHHDAKFVQYFSLRLTNCFCQMESPPIILAAPDFEQIFSWLEVEDPTWCPALSAA